MKRSHARYTHAATLAAAGTGLVYAWMRYLCEPADEFALVNHPLEPLLADLHRLTGPLLVFGLGLLWATHVVPKVRSGTRAGRKTGLVLAVSALPMVLSGYGLQAAVDEAFRVVWGYVHTGLGLVWVVSFVAHIVGRRRAGR
ncbi:MAG: hypothetical protein ACO4CT_16070 [Planctomycetota bacterium]